jgi:multidrug efflux pump subunit AcrA (membrane-fusion protein)
VKALTGDIFTYYSFSGNIQAKNRQTVMSEKVMQISEVDVKDGDAVKEGDILMKTTTGDEITAPIDGEVVNLNAEENAQVMAGFKLMDIVDYKHLEVEVKVDEYDLSAIKAGKETTVTIGAPIRPADTADSPITRAPTILTAWPIGLGSRTPASLNISNAIIIIPASTTAGKGTPS